MFLFMHSKELSDTIFQWQTNLKLETQFELRNVSTWLSLDQNLLSLSPQAQSLDQQKWTVTVGADRKYFYFLHSVDA